MPRGDISLHDIRKAPLRDLRPHHDQVGILSAESLRQEARRQIRCGDVRTAVIYLEALHLVRPSLDTTLELATLYRQCQLYTDGLELLRHSHELWPSRTDLISMQAEFAMLAKAYEQAAALWLRLIGHTGKLARYPLLRAIACFRQLQQEDAAQELIARYASDLSRMLTASAFEHLQHGLRGPIGVEKGLYMITGNNGTGKTTVGQWLQALGVMIVDADIEIAAFCDGRRWAILRYDLSLGSPESEANIDWIWPRERFERACAESRVSERAVFVIGGFGATVMPYVQCARRVFHLTAPTKVIAHRLAGRGSPAHRVGSAGYNAALRRNAGEAQPRYPAQIISAEGSVWQSCAAILDGLGVRIAPQARRV